MASLLALPRRSDAFTQYRPSKNAHVEFLSANDASKSDTGKDVKVIKLIPRGGHPKALVRCRRSRANISIAQAGDKSPRDDLGPLLASIGPILRGEKTVQSFHHLSAACHRLVLPPYNYGPDLYSTIESELKNSISTLVRSWRGAIMGREPAFLARFVQDWREWEKRVVSIWASPISVVTDSSSGSSGGYLCLPR
jgi:cullin-4